MKTIELTKVMVYPETKEDLTKEPTLDRHERYLRCLILNGFIPIYLGDKVKVRDTNEKGTVVDMSAGLQAAFNIDYLIYKIQTETGKHFETYYYNLDVTKKSEGNVILEKILRESNANFASRVK